MGVGAADAESGDRGAAGSAGVGPLPVLGQQRDRAGAPVDFGCGLVDVEGSREGAVVHGERHFEDACGPGGGLGMADVGFDGSEP